jgi:hypothetical protein
MSERAKASNQMDVQRLTFHLPVKRAKASGHQELGSETSGLLAKRLKLPDTQSPYHGKKDRKVEVGSVTKVNPVPFEIIFETVPVWLLVLEPSICSGVYFRGFDTAHNFLEIVKGRGVGPTLFNRAVSQLGVGHVHFDGSVPPPEPLTTLISGSYPFLQEAAAVVCSRRTLLVLDEPWRGKTPTSVNQVSWKRVRPTHFGGSICYPVLVGFSGFKFEPKGSSLGHTIGHVLDHGI